MFYYVLLNIRKKIYKKLYFSLIYQAPFAEIYFLRV